MIASLDHVMWFHRPCRADEWLLYHCHSPSAAAARAGSRPARSSARDGTLVRHDRAGGPHPPGGDRRAPRCRHRRDVVDLRSDTVTTPTPEMRRAMADAEVGDDAYGEDPTVRRLESLAAGAARQGGRAVRAVGHDGEPARAPAARRGRAPRCCAATRAHVYRYEHAAAAGNAGVQLRPAARRRRPAVAPTTSTAALASQQHHLPEISRVVAREHAHAGERPAVAPGRARRGDRRVARTAGSRCTATARASGTRRSRSACRRAVLAATTDTVMFCLSKGLGAPVGSVLCGTARRDRRGARRPVAPRRRDAPGRRDRGGRRRRARDDGRPPGRRPRTRPHASPSALAERVPGQRRSRTRRDQHRVRARERAPGRPRSTPLAADGVLAGTIDVDTVRFVTHKDVDDADLDRADRRARRRGRRRLT